MKTIPAFISILSLLILLSTSAMACHEQVHVQDELGNDMTNVEVRLESSCGWSSQTDDTNQAGWTKNWAVWKDCQYNASIPTPPEGYVCDKGSDYNTGGAGKIYLTCTPVEEVPEFGALAAIGIVTLAGIFIYKKRN